MLNKFTLLSLCAVTLFCAVAIFFAAPVQASVLSGITSPAANNALTGEVAIRGTADHPEFRKWQIDLVLAGEDGHATFLALGKQPVRNATFFDWDTTAYPDGEHQLRLRVVHSNLNYDEYYVPVTLHNGRTAVTALEFSSPAPSEDTTQSLAGAASPSPAVAAPEAPAAPQGVERWIEIDISDQRLRAWEGDQTVFDYTVSTGKPGHRTLPGTFSVYRKYEETRMRGYDYDTPDVPWTMYYSGAFAIHGAYWHEDFGTPVSHGCVNLPVEEAKALYEWADMGTVVVVRQ